jgi:hypothetical protein
MSKWVLPLLKADGGGRFQQRRTHPAPPALAPPKRGLFSSNTSSPRRIRGSHEISRCSVLPSLVVGKISFNVLAKTSYIRILASSVPLGSKIGNAM